MAVYNAGINKLVEPDSATIIMNIDRKYYEP